MHLDETFLHSEPKKRATTRTRRRRRNEAFSPLVGGVGENKDKTTLGKKKSQRIRLPLLGLPRSRIALLLCTVWILGCLHLVDAVPHGGDHSGGGASGINLVKLFTQQGDDCFEMKEYGQAFQLYQKALQAYTQKMIRNADAETLLSGMILFNRMAQNTPLEAEHGDESVMKYTSMVLTEYQKYQRLAAKLNNDIKTQLDMEVSNAHLARAMLANAKERHSTAFGEYQTSLTYNPRNLMSISGLAYLVYWKYHDYNMASKLYQALFQGLEDFDETILGSYSNYFGPMQHPLVLSNHYCILGECYDLLHLMNPIPIYRQRSRMALEKALELNPEDDDLRSNLESRTEDALIAETFDFPMIEFYNDRERNYNVEFPLDEDR